MRYGLIGCGNMGGAVARALCKGAGPGEMLLSSGSGHTADALAAQLGCQSAGTDNARAADACAYLVLAVKPQKMAGVLAGIAPVLAARGAAGRPPVLVTMAAGLSIARIRALAGAGEDWPVIRIMPNTPVAVGAGMTLWCAEADAALCAPFLRDMAPAGALEPVPEALMDAAGCVAGCGPAWAYQFLEALADGGVAAGLPRQTAQRCAAQMLLGAATLALQSGQHPGALKDAVCSPGGSTIEGVRVLEQRAFRAAVTDAVLAAYEKTKGLGKA